MAIKPVSGEIKAQVLNDNFSALDSNLANLSIGPFDTYMSLSALQSAYPNGRNGFAVVLESDGKTGYMYTWTGTTWKKGGLAQAMGIADNSVSVQKLDAGMLQEYSANRLVFRWGTVNAISGELIGLNNVALTSPRAVSHDTFFKKGTKFTLVDTLNYRVWLNIFTAEGMFTKSISLNSNNRWHLEFDSIVYIVLALSTDAAFDAITLKNIQGKLLIEGLKSEFDVRYPLTATNLNVKDSPWYFKSINNETGSETKVNHRVVSELIFLQKGTVISSNAPASCKWAIHLFNEDGTWRNLGKGFGNSYLNYLVEEDAYAKFVMANIDDSNIELSSSLINKLVVMTPYNTGIKRESTGTKFKSKVIPFFYGTGNAETGELYSGGNSRIRTEKHFYSKNTLFTTDDLSVQFAIYVYDVVTGEYLKNESSSFVLNRKNFYLEKDALVAIVLAETDNSVIEDKDITSDKLRILTTTSDYLKLVDDSKKKIISPIPKNINIPFEFASSLSWIGEELWIFHPSEDDNTQQTLAKSFIIDYEENKAVQTGDVKINWGHVNTLNYSKDNDSLIFSNGNIGDTNERSKFFYVLESFTTKKNQSSIDISGCIKYDVSSFSIENTKGLSVALQPCWGDSNDYRNNVIYLLWNDGNIKKISKIVLGQGNHDLGNGFFISGKTENEFNGTMKLIKTFDGHAYTDVECTQDATCSDGFIFEGIGHDGFWYDKIILDDINNTFSKVSFRERHYTSDGDLYNSVTNGITIKDGVLYTTIYHRANTDKPTDYVKLVSRNLF